MLVVDPITVGNFAFLAGWLDLRFYDGLDLKTFLKMRGLGPEFVSVVEPFRVNCLISFTPVFSCIYC